MGENLDILGPLGNGFDLTDTDRHAVFVGGGIGAPPLFGAAQKYGTNSDAILGFRSASAAILTDDFGKVCNKVMIATDDGTLGHHGLVTDLLKKRLKEPCDIIYACGPKPMLKAIAEIAEENDIECQVSLEERMACGVGACLGCAVRIISDGKEKYLHVCKDGPVFNAREVVW